MQGAKDITGHIQNLKTSFNNQILTSLKIPRQLLMQIIHLITNHEQGLAGLNFYIIDTNTSVPGQKLPEALMSEIRNPLQRAMIFYGLAQEKRTPGEDNHVKYTLDEFKALAHKYKDKFTQTVRSHVKTKNASEFLPKKNDTVLSVGLPGADTYKGAPGVLTRTTKTADKMS